MQPTAPEWLTRRGGALKLGSDHRTWFVVWDGKPQHKLTIVPVEGKFGCTIRQTINGRLLPNPKVADTPDLALVQGLNELGTTLGWR